MIQFQSQQILLELIGNLFNSNAKTGIDAFLIPVIVPLGFQNTTIQDSFAGNSLEAENESLRRKITQLQTTIFLMIVGFTAIFLTMFIRSCLKHRRNVSDERASKTEDERASKTEDESSSETEDERVSVAVRESSDETGSEVSKLTDQPPPTDKEDRKCSDETGFEKVNNKLSYSIKAFASGNQGTSVHRGTYDSHARVIKRLPLTHYSVAGKEIDLLLSVNNKNVVRCFGYEQDKFFTFIVLEACDCNLRELMKTFLGPDNEKKEYYITNLKDGFHLWEADGKPSQDLIKLMKGIASGLQYLHRINIIHRDIKLSNVLLLFDHRSLIPKLSNMGISKLLGDKSSDYGSSGWRAPELLSHGRHTKAVDMFSLGCLLFYCVSRGYHPFGKAEERDLNIRNDNHDLTIIDCMPEAYDLISKLLKHTPSERLNISQVLRHPFFWGIDFKMDFITLISNKIKVEWDNQNSSTLATLVEQVASTVFTNGWKSMIDPAILNYCQNAGRGGPAGRAGRGNQYDDSRLVSLLRLIRNSKFNDVEMSSDTTINNIIGGSNLNDIYNYYFQQFPNLVIQLYHVVCNNLPFSADPEFEKYI